MADILNLVRERFLAAERDRVEESKAKKKSRTAPLVLPPSPPKRQKTASEEAKRPQVRQTRDKEAVVATDLPDDVMAMFLHAGMRKRRPKKDRFVASDRHKPRDPIGPVCRVSTIFTKKPFVTQSDSMVGEIEAILRANSLLTVTLWTAMRFVFNTVTGDMAFFFAHLYNSEGDYPVVISHWSLIQRIMIQRYRCFTRVSGTDKAAIQRAFHPLLFERFNKQAMMDFCRVTGADPMTETRAIDESHFAFSVLAFRVIRDLLAPMTSLVEVLDFCTGCSKFREIWGQYPQEYVISGYGITDCQQSKFSAAAIRSSMPRMPYDDLTPSFHVPWSDAQVRALSVAMEVDPPGHFRSVWEMDRKVELVSRDQIVRTVERDGLVDDRVKRPLIKKDSRTAIHKKFAEDVLLRHGLYYPRPGRPSGSDGIINATAALLKRESIDRMIMSEEELKESDQRIAQLMESAIKIVQDGVQVAKSDEYAPLQVQMIAESVNQAQLS